MILYMFYIEFR